MNEYYLSNLNYTNSLYKSIENKVVNESESSHETPRRDLLKEFNQLEQRKITYFKLKNSDMDNCIQNFEILLKDIETIVEELFVARDQENLDKFNDLLMSTKLAFSTSYFFGNKFEKGMFVVNDIILRYPKYFRAYVKKLEALHILKKYEEGHEIFVKLRDWLGTIPQKDKDYFESTKTKFLEDYNKYIKVFKFSLIICWKNFCLILLPYIFL